jgi:hypothetical protein
MDAHSHNLLEPYYADGGNIYHYNSLRSDASTPESYFNVTFTRDVTSSGIVINITGIAGSTTPTADDTTFLTNEVNSFVGIPVNGTECQTLGWTYLGNTDANKADIDSAITSATASGYSFKSIFYHQGYFVHGCADTKQFYDQKT